MSKDEFLDEKIIEMVNQSEKPEEDSVPFVETKPKEIPPEERTIYTGIKIDGRWLDFEERTLVEGKITMMVPKEFTEMDMAIAKIKYPSEERPETILTDGNGATNIMFSYMEDTMVNEESEEVRDQLLAIMRRVNPGIKPLSTGMEVISDKNVAYVEFSNPAIDGKLYNLMFFLELNGRTLMGSFNCFSKAMKYWKKPALEMMQSIQVIKIEDGEAEIREDENI